MKNSLFGHIVTRFAAHPENVATEALCYILGASAVARTTFIDFLKGFVPELPTELMFRTQRVGKANDIPDVLGTDESGRETVIVEAKFWAGLTDNQPTAYLKRLPHGYSALLIFLVPDARLITLWPELLRRCTEAGMQPERVDPSGKLLRAQFRGLHRYRETPLWLEVKDQNWQTSSDLRASLLNLELQTPSRLVVGRDDNLLVPLFLPMGRERDVVLLSLVSQIREVASALPDHTSEPAPA